jgi:hypothetical protein
MSKDELTKAQYLEVQVLLTAGFHDMGSKIEKLGAHIDSLSKRLDKVERTLILYRVWATSIAFMITFGLNYAFDILKVVKNVTRNFAKVH